MRVPDPSSPLPARAIQPLPAAALLFVVSALFILVLFGILAPGGHLIYAWPLTGVQLALLLGSSRSSRGRLPEILAAGAGSFAATFALGFPFSHALVPSCSVALELWVCLRVLRSSIGCFDDFKRRANVFRFLLVTIAVPLFSSLDAPLILPGATASVSAAGHAILSIALADSLGIAVFAPAVLLLLSAWGRNVGRRPLSSSEAKGGVLAFALFLSATTAIFSQNSTPILFLMFPPLIAVVYILGIEGAALAGVFATVLGSIATALGHGPIWINANASMDQRILILQFFLWTMVATALPVGSLLDERRSAEQHARTNQAIYQTLLANSEDMIILSRLDGSSRFVSPAVSRMTGWTPEEYTSLPHVGGIHPEDRDLARSILASLAAGKVEHNFRYRVLRKDGGFRWVEALVRGYSDFDGGPITGYVATIRDISALKETEESWSAEKQALASENAHLATLAGRDELTTLANRRTFNQVLSLEANRQIRSSDALSLLMIDVDHFKRYNDRYGHQAGDLCLQSVACALMRSAARHSDLAARVGGEEFAILLPQTDAAGAVQVASLLLHAVQQLAMPHQDSPGGIVTISIGVATWLPHHPGDVHRLMQEADEALYESKRTGRNRYSTFAQASATAAAALSN